jgi:hypothetical protein
LNRYTNEGIVLGHPLGPDADRVALAVTHDVSENATLAIDLSRERHGAQRVDSPQTPLNPSGLGFPTPPVARRARCSVGVSWRPRVTSRLDSRVEYVEGSEGSGWSAQLAVTLRRDWRVVREERDD